MFLLPRSHAQIRGLALGLRDHAVRQLEKEPPLAGGTPGVRPGRCAPRVPALTRVVGQQLQKAWTTGTKKDGSVTHKDGSGWARIVSRDNLEGAGCTSQLVSQGAWSWGRSDQEHQHCSSWGSHLESSDSLSPQSRAYSPGGARGAVLE